MLGSHEKNKNKNKKILKGVYQYEMPCTWSMRWWATIFNTQYQNADDVKVSNLQLEVARMSRKADESFSRKLIEGSTIAEMESKNQTAKVELAKKDTEIFRLLEDRKVLEGEVSASKQILCSERERFQSEDERKSMTIANLEVKLKVTIL